MNKKLELDFSGFLLASESNNWDRAGKILNRLSFDQKEKLARGLLKSLYPTLNSLPGGTILAIKKEFGFELVQPSSKEEVA